MDNTTPRYSPQIELGSILAGIVSVIVILGGMVAWGMSYGSLASAASQSAQAIIALSARVDVRDREDGDRDKILAGLQTDISYLRRYVEALKREASP